jgi:hypothetical protein
VIPKLNLVSALAALVFFFLPWTSIECRGERMVTQTGLQVITGSGKIEQRAQQGSLRLNARSDQSLGHSYLVAAALIAILGSLLMSFASLIAGRKDLDHGCGILSALALVCLLLQAAIGFPADKAIRDDILKPPAPKDAGIQIDLGELGQALGQEVLANIRVRPMPGFYATLAALALPTLILGNAFLDRIKAKES